MLRTLVVYKLYIEVKTWPEQSKPQESQLEERHQESNSLLRLPESPTQHTVESRSPTDTDLVLLLFVRSDVIKRALNF